jgi:site-specific DNA recombinase
VRSVLFRELYRGVETWNRTKKRNATFGQKEVRDRAASEWLRVDMPERRIVSDELWSAAHARIAKARANYLAGTLGTRWGRPVSGTAAKYLLTGFGRCGVCGSGLTVRSRAHGNAPRSFRYVCSAHHYRGSAICPNGQELRLEVADATVIELVRHDVLRPTVVEPAIRMALDTLMADAATRNERRSGLQRQLAAIEGRIRQLTAAIEEGGHLPALLAALRAREQERTALEAEVRSLASEAQAPPRDRRALERRLREQLTDWQGLMSADIANGRQVLEQVLGDRLTFTPTKDERGQRCYRMTGTFAFGRLCSEILRSHGMASPTGFEPVFQP